MTQITQETSTCDDRTLGLLFTSRMRRLYGFQNDRILLSPPVLEKNLLRSVPQKICLSHCDTSFECLACQLMAGSMYSVRSCEEYGCRENHTHGQRGRYDQFGRPVHEGARCRTTSSLMPPHHLLILMTCPGLLAVAWARSFTLWSGQGLWAQIPGCGEQIGD